MGTSDPITLDFYARIGRINKCDDNDCGDVKNQCLRYCRWPEVETMEDEDDAKDVLNSDSSSSSGPLWIQSRHLPSSASTTNDNDDNSNDECENYSDIPNCEYCGSVRKFEFQIMPQMLYFLHKRKHNISKNNNSNNNSNNNDNQQGNDHGKGKSITQNPAAMEALRAVSDILERTDNNNNNNSDNDEQQQHQYIPQEMRDTQRKLLEQGRNDLMNMSSSNNKGIGDVGDGIMDMDWGTIAVYTCTSSCSGNNTSFRVDGVIQKRAYRKKFAWRLRKGKQFTYVLIFEIK